MRQESTLESTVLEKLVEANLVYQADIPPETLKTLASIFSEDLAGENAESVWAAFDLHRKRATRFPTPAHILALLPECRVIPQRLELPVESGRKTEGYARLCYAAWKGDMEAKAAMDAIIAKANRSVRP